MKNFKKNLTAFVVSGFISLITLFYVTLAYSNKNFQPKIHFELFIIAIPVMYGLFGVINYNAVQKFGTCSSLVVGALFGLLLSVIGRFGLNLPQLIFNFTKKDEFMVHIIAIVLYALIFRFGTTPLTEYIVSKKL